MKYLVGAILIMAGTGAVIESVNTESLFFAGFAGGFAIGAGLRSIKDALPSKQPEA